MFRKLIFIILFFIPVLVYAETNVEISSSKNEVNVWESFELHIQISTDSQQPIQIQSIWGIDVFKISGTRSSDNIQIINGKVSSTKNINYVLESTQKGDFILWPITLSWEDWETISKTLQIHIWEIPPIINSIEQTTVKEEKNMNDIHSVKYLKMIWNDFLYVPILIFLFWFWVYFILNKFFWKYLHQLNQIWEPKQIIKKEKTEIQLLISQLQKLWRKIDTIEKWIFYTELNYLFRKYFEINNIIWAQKLTLEEIKKLTKEENTEVLQMFEESYFLEFSHKITRIETRKKMLQTFLDYIKTHNKQ